MVKAGEQQRIGSYSSRMDRMAEFQVYGDAASEEIFLG